MIFNCAEILIRFFEFFWHMRGLLRGCYIGFSQYGVIFFQILRDSLVDEA
jgi:hypothetical protein